MSSRSRKSRSSDRKRDKRSIPQNVPSVYPPPIPGYPMPPPPQWMPPGYQYPPFYQPWNANEQFPGQVSPQWMTGQPIKNQQILPAPAKSPLPGSNEYMVNALSRIYSNDDGSIEIERVKVQRRAGGSAEPKVKYPQIQNIPPESNVIVRAVPGDYYEKKPPPRKNRKRNGKIRDVSTLDPPSMASKDQASPPWYPFVPYMPQPYTYPPYPYGYMWPSPPSTGFECESLTDESGSSTSRHETQPSSRCSHRSQNLDSGNVKKSFSPDHPRAHSSAAHSHLTESQSTDIAPSDSVSMGGYRRKHPDGILRGSNRSSYTTDRASAGSLFSSDAEKTKEWMEDMKKVLAAKMEDTSDGNVDRTSFMTANSDIPTPPISSPKSSSPPKKNHKKSNSESNIVITDILRSSNVSPPLLSNTRVSDTDLMYAFKKLENSADTFKSHADYSKGRESRASTLSFHSTRQSADDDHLVDTDSTDIALPTDSPFGSNEQFQSKSDRIHEEDLNFKWILQFSDKRNQEEEKESGENLKDSWRAEVSLWRAHLVVSLCKGQGLDQEDWDTFQLLVQHPLSMDKKLTLLHPQRICSLNRELGVVFLRNALLHLTTYGEALLKPEDIRPMGWKTIPYDGNQLWYPVKGAIEILHVFGYRLRGNSQLKHKRRYAPDISVLARLTLDILVLTEELRLYLTGAHQYSINISNIFAPLPFDENLDTELIKEFQEHEVSKDIQHSTFISREEDLESRNIHENAVSSGPLNEDTQSIATVSSLPELQSINSTKNTQHKASESSGSATPTGPSDIVINVKSNTITANKKTTTTEQPVDHVYEEINEIKAQVQALKEKENMRSENPPPLPPKQRSNNESFESPYSDAYSQVDSQCSSIQGSVSSRRKKRKAPMPPKRLLKSHSSESETVNVISKKKKDEEIYRSKNPFYEDLKPLGHVGRNPFYETISVKKSAEKPFPVMEIKEAQEPKKAGELSQIQAIGESSTANKNAVAESKASSETSKISLVYQKSYSIDETDTNDEDNSVIFAVRPQRRKNKRQAPKVLETCSKDNIIEAMSKDEVTIEDIKIVTSNGALEMKENIPDRQVVSNQITDSNQFSRNRDVPIILGITEKKSPKSSPEMRRKKSELESSKNELGEPQCHSQVVVPSSEMKDESSAIAKNVNDHIVQKIVISYDICLIKSRSSLSPYKEKEGTSLISDKNELLNKKEKDLMHQKSTEKKDILVNIATNEKVEEIAEEKELIKETNDKLELNETSNIFDSDDIIYIDSDEYESISNENNPLSGSLKVHKDKLVKIEKLDKNIINDKELPPTDLTLKEESETSGIDPLHTISCPLISETVVFKNEIIHPLQISLSKQSAMDQSENLQNEHLENNSTSFSKKQSPDNNLEKLDTVSESRYQSVKEPSYSNNSTAMSNCSTREESNNLQMAIDTTTKNNTPINYTDEPTQISRNENDIHEPRKSTGIFKDTEDQSQNEQCSFSSQSQHQNEQCLFSSQNQLYSKATPPTPPSSSPPPLDVPPLPPSNSPPKFDSVVFNVSNAALIDEADISSEKNEEEVNKTFENPSELVLISSTATESLCKSNDIEEPLKKEEDIVSTVKDVEEERYEIPDVTRAEAIDNERRKKISTESSSILSLDGTPSRPPRSKTKCKAPPPLPPKSHLNSLPPALPPKNEHIQSSSTPLKSKSSNSHALSPSPLAIPSIAPHAYTAPSITTATRSHPTNVTYLHNTYPSDGSQTTLERPHSAQPPRMSSGYPPKPKYKSSSMPSSPKPIGKKTHTTFNSGFERKSWPFQLCTCVNGNKNNYDKVPYKRK